MHIDVLNARGVISLSRPVGLDESAGFSLKDATFLDPYGMVLAACAAQRAAEIGQTTYEPPTQADPHKYLTRAHFDQTMSHGWGLHPTRYVDVFERDQKGWLCELTSYDSSGAPDSLLDLLQARLAARLTEQAIVVLHRCVCEATANIGDHARVRSGYVAAQVYERRGTKPRLVFAVGDAGQGISASLRRKLGAGVTPEDALRAATDGHVSATDDPGRGTGLSDMVKAVRDAHGFLVVQSGGAITMSPPAGPRTTRNLKTTMQHGCTIVAVQIPCDGDGG